MIDLIDPATRLLCWTCKQQKHPIDMCACPLEHCVGRSEVNRIAIAELDAISTKRAVEA